MSNQMIAVAQELGIEGAEDRYQIVNLMAQNGIPEANAQSIIDEILEDMKYQIIDLTPVAEAGIAVSDIYLSGTAGDPSYTGYDDNIENFEYAGIEAKGFWNKAWKYARGAHDKVDDGFQEIVLGAIECVIENPEITEQDPGYLLQRASWKAQNNRSKADQTYMVKTHGIQVIDIDQEVAGDADGHEAIAAQVVDNDLRIAVRQVVNQIESETTYKVAKMLMNGMTKKRVAEELGISQPAVSQHVKKLRGIMSELI